MQDGALEWYSDLEDTDRDHSVRQIFCQLCPLQPHPVQ